jgi:acyl-coenzyme A synthetase/AMP-(fatty) acid ligase
VVGLADPTWGQVVAAAIVPREPVSEEALRSHLAARLPGHEVPRRWAFVQELPRNATGKVRRPEVARLFP